MSNRSELLDKPTRHFCQAVHLVPYNPAQSCTEFQRTFRRNLPLHVHNIQATGSSETSVSSVTGSHPITRRCRDNPRSLFRIKLRARLVSNPPVVRTRHYISVETTTSNGILICTAYATHSSEMTASFPCDVLSINGTRTALNHNTARKTLAHLTVPTLALPRLLALPPRPTSDRELTSLPTDALGTSSGWSHLTTVQLTQWRPGGLGGGGQGYFCPPPPLIQLHLEFFTTTVNLPEPEANN